MHKLWIKSCQLQINHASAQTKYIPYKINVDINGQLQNETRTGDIRYRLERCNLH